MKKTLFSFFMAIAMILSALPGTIFAASPEETLNDNNLVNSGECGSFATWNISAAGVLSIDGVGEMSDYVQPDSETSENSEAQDAAFESADKNQNANLQEETSQEAKSQSGTTQEEDPAKAENQEETIPKSEDSSGTSQEAVTGKEDFSGQTPAADGAEDNNSDQKAAQQEASSSESSSSAAPWYGRSDITSIEIGSGITKIGANAFAGLTGVTRIRIKGSRPVFGDNCFGDIIADVVYQPDETWSEEDLQNYGGILIWTEEEEGARGEGTLDTGVSWSLDNNGTLILSGSGEIPTEEEYPWDPYNNEITKIIVGNDITAIGAEAFDGTVKLTDLELGSGLQIIGENAFARCEGLETLIIPSNVEQLGYGAFASCRLLTVTFSGNAPAVANGIEDTDATVQSSTATAPFDGNGDITIIYPDGDNTWTENARAAIGGRRAKWMCVSSLTGTCGENLTWTYDYGTLKISGSGEMDDYNISFDSDTLELVYNYPWRDLEASIRSLYVEDGVTGIGDMAFAQCEYLTSVTLPDTLESIGKNAFNGCISLQEVSLPQNISILEEYAFSNCSNLTSITLGSGLTEIENDVFKNDNRLKYINYRGSTQTWKLISIDSDGNNVLDKAEIRYSN